MPKSAKNYNKAKKQIVTSYADLEKDFFKAKNNLLKQSELLISDLSKRQKQIKSQISKALIEKKQAKNMQVSLMNSLKKNKNKTSQKQLKMAKQAYDAAVKLFDSLQVKSVQLVTQLGQARIANKKYSLLDKTIEKFNSGWEKKSAKASKGKSRRKVRKIKTVTDQPVVEVLPVDVVVY